MRLQLKYAKEKILRGEYLFTKIGEKTLMNGWAIWNKGQGTTDGTAGKQITAEEQVKAELPEKNFPYCLLQFPS